MAHRRTIISLQLVLTLAASIFMLAAEAIQLGDIRAHSALGQPLDATVGVWLTTNDKTQPLRLKVSPDIAYRANSNMASLVAGMSAEMHTAANGANYIRLRSDSVMNEPVLAFRVKVYVGDNAVMRNYSLALNPAPPARPAKSRRRASAGTPITDPDYTVNSGDTLWAIARRVGRTTGADTNDLVTQIFANNPHAFVDGNRDRLILGAALRLPLGANATASVPAAATSSPTVVATPGTVPVAATPASEAAVIAPAAATPAPAASSGTVPTQSTRQTATTPRQPVDWRLRDPQLAAELERLRLKYLALKQQYDTQQQPARNDAAAEAPATAQTAAPDTTAVTDTDPVAATTAPSTAVTVSEQPASTDVATAGTTEAAVTADDRPAGGMPSVTMIAFAAAALALLALLAFGLRKGRAAMKKRQSEVAHHAREADFKAEVARKAANRVQMESEVQRMLANRDASNVKAATVDATPAADESAKPAVSTDAEIDQNIAHGRYNEAEAQLIAVIAANPKNYSAKLRLLEVYYMIEEVDPFCDVADDLHVNHRADLSDDEWRRVIRMGKITAPDRMPFSGPRALDIPNEAS